MCSGRHRGTPHSKRMPGDTEPSQPSRAGTLAAKTRRGEIIVMLERVEIVGSGCRLGQDRHGYQTRPASPAQA